MCCFFFFLTKPSFLDLEHHRDYSGRSIKKCTTMGGGHLLHLSNFSRASRIKRLTAHFPVSVKRYAVASDRRNHGVEERALLTEDEFRRAAEEKKRQGFASQTLEKAEDGAGEAAEKESDFGSVKESYKEAPPGRGKFHKTGDAIPPENWGCKANLQIWDFLIPGIHLLKAGKPEESRLGSPCKRLQHHLVDGKSLFNHGNLPKLLSSSFTCFQVKYKPLGFLVSRSLRAK